MLTVVPFRSNESRERYWESQGTNFSLVHLQSSWGPVRCKCAERTSRKARCQPQSALSATERDQTDVESE